MIRDIALSETVQMEINRMSTFVFDIETVDGEKWQYLGDDSGTFGNRPDPTFDHIEDLLAWVNSLATSGALTSFKRTLIGGPDYLAQLAGP